MICIYIHIYIYIHVTYIRLYMYYVHMFMLLTCAGYLLKQQFQQTMGVMGLTDDHFLADRMFEVPAA